MKKAFTLIELLVVVLIIGILSAIALPQYQKAVIKSKIGAMLPTLRTLAEANEIYYMENGQYTMNMNNLSVATPADCTALTEQLWKCGTDFVIDNSSRETILNYCAGKNSDYSTCRENRTVIILAEHKFSGQATAGKWRCTGGTNGQKICKALGF